MDLSSVSEVNMLRKRILEKVKATLNEDRVYDAFLKDTYIFKIDNDKMIISCANSLSTKILEDKYNDMLLDIVNNVSGTNFKLVYGLEEDLKKQENKNKDLIKKPRFFENNYLEPAYNFDNYVVGSTNQEAFTAALYITSAPGTDYNPLFIYSQSGLGKTHLLNAIGNYIKERTPIKKILFCSSQEFIDEYIKYVNGEKTEDNLKDYILSFDILLIDDIQMLQNKTKTEEFFFSVFESLVKTNKQIVLTCDRLPNELNGLDNRLVTRFLRGLTISIQTPTAELCEEILKKKIVNSGLSIENFDEEVIKFVAFNFKNSIRNLEGALNRLIFYSSINHVSHIDMDITNDALSSLIDTKKNKSKISEQKILNAVSSYYSVSVPQITGKLKTSQVATARHVAIYLIRTMLDVSFVRIGELFSNRDHATIMYSVNKIEKMLKTDDKMLTVINKLKKQLS